MTTTRADDIQFAIDVLLHARDLVAAGWTQGCWARDADDTPVDYVTGTPASYCMGAAIDRAIVDHYGGWYRFLQAPAQNRERDVAVQRMIHSACVRAIPDFEDITPFNDHPGRIQAQILDALDAAVRFLKDGNLTPDYHPYSPPGTPDTETTSV